MIRPSTGVASFSLVLPVALTSVIHFDRKLLGSFVQVHPLLYVQPVVSRAMLLSITICPLAFVPGEPDGKPSKVIVLSVVALVMLKLVWMLDHVIADRSSSTRVPMATAYVRSFPLYTFRLPT